MVGIKEVESECRFRAVEGRGVPTHMKELAEVFVGDAARTAFAEPDLYFVPTIVIDDGELTAGGDCGAHVTIVSKVTDISK